MPQRNGMSLEKSLQRKLETTLSPIHLEVINESERHSVPAGSESHFKVVAVSTAFEGKSLVDRHRMINQIVAEELKESIHALALHLYTPSEWAKKKEQAPQSPPCLGGSKGDR